MLKILMKYHTDSVIVAAALHPARISRSRISISSRRMVVQYSIFALISPIRRTWGLHALGHVPGTGLNNLVGITEKDLVSVM